MNFEKLTLTIVNFAMMLSVIMYLREKFITKRRSDAEGLKAVFEIKQKDIEKVSFLRRKSSKLSILAVLFIIAIVIFIASKDIQAALESIVYGLMAGTYMIILNRLDEGKSVGIFEHGILYKTGFIQWRDVKGIEWGKADAYKDAYDMSVKTQSKTKINLVVRDDDKGIVETLIKGKIK